MKIMFLNKVYTARAHLDESPCNPCMYSHAYCAHIPSDICVQYGGFQPSDTKIFTL